MSDKYTQGPWVANDAADHIRELEAQLARRDARIAELESTIPTGKAPCARFCEHVALNSQHERDKKRIAELERDAARYRWIKMEHNPEDNPLAQVVWKRHGERNSSQWANVIDGNSLDCLIDAAMQASQP